MVQTRLLSLAVLAVLMLASSGAASAADACPASLYHRAEASLAKARATWPALLKHQATFGACDDGALAEGYSDAVVTTLAHRWDSFGDFAALSSKHPAFRRWAIRHIDATASDDDLRRIVRNAAKCGAQAGGLCGAIRQAARNASAEQNQLTETKVPDCSGPDRWPAGTAFTALKNDGAITSDTVDFDHVTSVAIASEKIGADLWRQVFRVTFPIHTGKGVEAIVVSDASSEECSMSDAQVYLIGKAL